MRKALDRTLGVFATLFIPMLPLLAGIITQASHTVIVESIAVRMSAMNGRLNFEPLPLAVRFVFNNFHALLWGLFISTIVLLLLALLQWRVVNAVERLGRLLLLAIAGASLGGGFLAFYLVAAAHALRSLL
ncbi:MAG: hypothetical protein LBD01_02695 [Puniceicoccales bacterium]|jgi:hypothetical protein|nr:hypothetical protein [Puniceicoccales bacterium]